MKRKILFTIAGLVLASSISFGITGKEIMTKADELDDGNTRRQEMIMTLIDKRGKERVREILMYSKDYKEETKNIMYFQSPPDVKGTGFLSYDYDDKDRDDDRWLYLPALRKVRRISSSNKDDYFMGTDFTYDDMGDREVEEDAHKLLAEEKVDGYKCWIVESIPVDKDDSKYSKTIKWVRKDINMIIKMDFYNKKGELSKQMTVSDIRDLDGIWTGFKRMMDNIEDNHKTILETKTMVYNNDIKEKLFKVSTIQRGRLK